MNVNIGAPYEAIMDGIIDKGYAGNRTEVIRQALAAYGRDLAEEEEVRLVAKGIEKDMADIRSGRGKTKTFEELKRKYKM